MRFAKFEIRNFKGIEHVIFDLDKSIEANIFTLVGLNESGKTTILEALNFFDPSISGVKALDLAGSTIKDYNSLIPISKRDNFNDVISIDATFKLDEKDNEAINKYATANTIVSSIKKVETLRFSRKYIYKDSKFEKGDYRWDGLSGTLKSNPRGKPISFSEKEHPEVNLALAGFCAKLIPSILYFPNFLFEFPSKIYLERKDVSTAKEVFYIELTQDILNSLENKTLVDSHLVGRIKSDEEADKKNLDRLIQLMEKKITDVIFEAWNRIFKRKIRDTKIALSYGNDDKNGAFLEFEIEAPDGIYQINERSLGFRWFFTFLLFTQFRIFRKDNPKNIIYLFDEPASNLHTTAQQLLLDSFGNLIKDSKIIYTTHSHYMINPNWLESTYVVKNEGLRLEDPESYNITKTNITIQSYREFVVKHPHQIAYFQPILDVLDYVPSNFDSVENSVLIEGKIDYYALSYFNSLVFDAAYKIHPIPGMGAGSLDTLTSLYTGWARDFIILIDSDEEGKKQMARYLDKFGPILKSKIYTFANIDSSWIKIGIEKLFTPDDALKMQRSCYAGSENFNKTHFGRSIQENLINKRLVPMEENTISNFKKVFEFLIDKMNKTNKP